MMRRLLSPLFFFACSLAHAGGASDTGFDPDALVAAAVKQVKSKAYRSGQTDWPALEARVRAAAQGARDPVDLLHAYHVLLQGLGDRHSYVASSGADRAEYKARHGREFDVIEGVEPRKRPTSRFMSRRDITVRPVLVGKSEALLIAMPSIGAGGARKDAFAQAGYAAARLNAATSCGYVIDLRGNTGGNIWPMFASLSNLFSDGPLSHGLGPGGERAGTSLIRQGGAYFKDGGPETLLARAEQWRDIPRMRTLPVAVLLDDGVASSGEGVAVAFKGRANTRFFGEKTAGLASGNEVYPVDGKTNLAVTVQMMADLKGKTYPDGITPDQLVAYGEGAVDDPDDAVVEAAKAWLQQAGCR